MQYVCVTIPPAVRPPLLRQMDTGSLTCAQIRVYTVHINGGQEQTSLHRSLTWRDRKTAPGLQI